MTAIQVLSLHTQLLKSQLHFISLLAISPLPSLHNTQINILNILLSSCQNSVQNTFSGWSHFQPKFENLYASIPVMIPITLPMIFPRHFETSQSTICSVPQSCFYSTLCFYASSSLSKASTTSSCLPSKNPTKWPTTLE